MTDERRNDGRQHVARGGTEAAGENRRGHYRVFYPPEARPRLMVDAIGGVHDVYEVLECSERGLSFLVPMPWPLPAGSAVSGTLVFARGADAHVAGVVVRVTPDAVALLLNKQGIALATILDEQRWLRANYLAS